MPILVFLILSGFPAIQAAAQATVQCGQETSQGKNWKYCVHRYPNSSRKVLYYLHGILGSEKDWKDHELERGIVRRWIARGEQPPIVVSVSFGPVWLLAEKNKGRSSGLFEIFSELVIPKIEIKILRFKPLENWLVGVSMGGFNGAQLYFKKPGFFSRVALICGAMATTTPYTDKLGFDQYIAESRAIPFLAWLSQLISRDHVPDPRDWPRHSPLDLAHEHFSIESTPLYVSNGLNDELGFHTGNLRFAKMAYDRGVFVQSDFYPGKGHCFVDSNPIADFFTQRIY